MSKKKIILISLGVIILISWFLYINREPKDISATDHITIKYNERGVPTAEVIRKYAVIDSTPVEDDKIKEVTDEKIISQIISGCKIFDETNVQLAIRGQIQIDLNNGTEILFDVNDDKYASLTYLDEKNRNAKKSYIIKISPSLKEYIYELLEL
jgi:hypothetical protein